MTARALEIAAREKRDWKIALRDAMEALPDEVIVAVADQSVLDSGHPEHDNLVDDLATRLSRGNVGPEATVAAAVLYGALMYGRHCVTTGILDDGEVALIAVDKASAWQSDYRAKVYRTDDGNGARVCVSVAWNGGKRLGLTPYLPDATDEVDLMGATMLALHQGWMP